MAKTKNFTSFVKYNRLYNRAIRRALKMSQGSLGENIGTNATMICWYEHGKSDEIVARFDYDVTKYLEFILGSVDDASRVFIGVQVLLYYREELENEGLLDDSTSTAIINGVKSVMRRGGL